MPKKIFVANKKKFIFFFRHRETDTHITVNQKKSSFENGTQRRETEQRIYFFIFFFVITFGVVSSIFAFFGVYVWIIETVRVFQHSHMHVNKIHFCLKALTSSI